MLEKLKSKYTVTEKRVTVDIKRNIKIMVRIFEDAKSKSKTPFILYPGGPGGSGSIYYDHVPFLIKSGPVILIDPRGTGDSDTNYPELWDLDHHIEDVEAVRLALKVSKFIFLGRSYGGVVAEAYALKYQQYLEKLILIVTIASYHFFKKAEENLYKYGNKDAIKSGMHILDGTIKDQEHLQEIFSDADSLYSYRVRNNPNLKRNYSGLKFQDFNYKCTNAGFGDFLRKIDFTSKLKNILIPTLIIGGKYDWICDPSFSYEIHMNIPNSRLVMLPGSHSLFFDCNKGYKTSIIDFVKDKI